MDVLKKIQSATLMESLVATVLIVVVFMTASLILNTLFSNTYLNNTKRVENRTFELEYYLYNRQIQLPYEEVYERWTIVMELYTEKDAEYVSVTLKNNITGKTLVDKRVYDEK